MSVNEKPVLHRIPFFPFLLALSPVLSLFSVNNWGSDLVEYIRPALVHLIFAFFIFVVCLKILKSSRKAAVLSFVPIFSVITFGHASNLIYAIKGSNIPDLYFLTAWTAVTLGLCYLLIRVLKKSSSQFFELTAILNTFGIVLVVLSLIHLALSRLPNNFEAETPSKQASLAEPVGHEWLSPALASSRVEDLPDFYFIIMDGYSRADVLESRFDFDNSEFVDWLGAKGFFVAGSGISNYAWTHLSLGSTLNAEYLQTLVSSKVKVKGKLPEDHLDRFHLFQNLLWSRFIKNSRVVRFFASLGYRIVSNRWVYKTAEEEQRSLTETFFGPLNETEKVLLKNSVLRPVFSNIKMGVLKYDEVMETFYSLKTDAKSKSPKFVFYHIMSPHEPFCFDSDGNPVPQHPYFDSTEWTTKYSMEGYRDYFRKNYPSNITGLNHHLKAAIQDILDNSQGNAVIVVQADHGSALGLDAQSPDNSDMVERFGILNAIYLPPGYSSVGLTDTMSSINTFPAVLNNVFNLEIPLQENRAYFSYGDLDFIDVTDRVHE